MSAPQRDPLSSTATTNGGALNALLGKGSEFEGNLTFEGHVRIDGRFTGKITTKDVLVVGEGARVAAEISCGSIVVHGEVVGNIRAKDSVELHAPARVKGDVATPSLMVEKGVMFQGQAKMEGDTESSSPSLHLPKADRYSRPATSATDGAPLQAS